MVEIPVYVDTTEVGTATIEFPKLEIPKEVWYTVGGVAIIALVGTAIWLYIRRRR